MQVDQIMSHDVVTIEPDATAASAARLLRRCNLGSVPVCSEDGRVRGIVTDRDILLRCVAEENDPKTTAVKEIMTRGVISVERGDDVRRAAQLMSDNQVRRLPVTEGGRLVGFVSLADMARSDMFTMEASKALTEISSNLHRR